MRTRILSPSVVSIRQASRILRQGGIVGMPTETVYGLAGAAFNTEALIRIFEVKERPVFDPLIIHVALKTPSCALAELEKLGLVSPTSLSETARAVIARLAESFWPGPLTLVLPKGADVPDLATSGLSTIAVRMPRHPIAQALIEEAGMPLAAPSANRFGRISPTMAEDVLKELGGRIEVILDGGPCEVGLESTILGVHPSGELTLLRPGGVALCEIKKLTGKKIKSAKRVLLTRAQPAPGMLASHYAPAKPLRILSAPVEQLRPDTICSDDLPQTLGLLVFGPAEHAHSRFEIITQRTVICRGLTKSGDLREAAKAFFSQLRYLDESEAGLIFAEPCPSEEHLGFAIWDRLRRASYPRACK